MRSRYRPSEALLTIGLVAAFAANTVIAAEGPPNREPKAERPQATEQAQQDRQAQQDGAAKRAERERNDGQGTPVLGVIVGKPADVEAAQVVRVLPGSPAGQAGLEAGDRIVKIGQESVNSPESLQTAVSKLKAGDRVKLEIERDGETRSITVKLGDSGDFAAGAAGREMPRAAGSSAWLGVQLAPRDSAVERGVKLAAVLPGSPAERAGLKAGDFIIRVDKTRMEAAADLQVEIGGRKPGEKVELVIERNDERKTIEVQLGTFDRWRGDFGQLTERQLRGMVEELLAGPLALAEEFSPAAQDRSARMKEEVELPTSGVAQLIPTKGSDVRGTIVLQQTDKGLHLSGEVENLEPGLHGFHIHEYGDIRDPEGKAAGGHFNPTGKKHGAPDDEEHHAGDFGNIRAGQDGVAKVDITAPWLKLHYVVGRGIVVHAGEDDLESQPSGDAGARLAVAVIGIAEPQEVAEKSKPAKADKPAKAKKRAKAAKTD